MCARHSRVQDIVGFTELCKQIPALHVMRFLNDYYSRLDAMLDIYKVRGRDVEAGLAGSRSRRQAVAAAVAACSKRCRCYERALLAPAGCH